MFPPSRMSRRICHRIVNLESDPYSLSPTILHVFSCRILHHVALRTWWQNSSLPFDWMPAASFIHWWASQLPMSCNATHVSTWGSTNVRPIASLRRTKKGAAQGWLLFWSLDWKGGHESRCKGVKWRSGWEVNVLVQDTTRQQAIKVQLSWTRAFGCMICSRFLEL